MGVELQSPGEPVSELRESFRSGKTRSYKWRKTQLKGILRMIVEKETEITDALYVDLSKPKLESFIHEITLAKHSCELTLKELEHWMKPEKVSSILTAFPSSSKIVSEPLGVVLIISAWNFPFLLGIDPVIGAIAAGNAVVLKPSESSPATSSLFARILPSYVDSSCIKIVEGSISETTRLLEQKWDKILYTGNAIVARIILAAAAKHLTPVVLELGGKCPVVVDSDIDLKAAARRIVVGKWGTNNGQACIAPDYIITTKSFSPKLVDALKTTLEKFYGKEPMKSEDLSRVVNSNHFSRLTRLLADEKVSGKVIHGGERDEKQLKIAPTLLLDIPDDSLMMQEEIFGPLLPIITVDNLEESFDLINSKPKPLAAYLFTTSKKLKEKFLNSVSAGGMLINDTTLHFTNTNLPFGGVGESGMGSYHGKFSFDAFTHKKGVLHRSFVGEVSARYPPYTPRKQKFLKAVLNGDITDLVLSVFGCLKS
ncbi:aldehyde dehydrogenase family 3 member H1 isoform X1 [Dendrobium catenatum]|uniref:Aldehyde dehydrogenase n=2 Tax=Dendrobium catenatum TaxID=906689 RepID=A0A2I0XH80_9ASPA|nr:aldehyde dehydrogenase family 3 member H1 isoform X1 [Dendrobium catenatum]PKU87244.1 Aldehyde dehydrogenase family 3 member H1 [Dendrobium catenatum]